MKWQNLFTNLFTTVGLMGLIGLELRGLPALAQTNPASAGLNGELSQAVCQQDWARAVRVVDRMRPVTPVDRRGELTVYRSRLQALLNSGTPIPNWQCGTGSAALSTIPPVTTAPSSPGTATNPANGAEPPIRGVRRPTSDSRNPSNDSLNNANPTSANPNSANPNSNNPTSNNPTSVSPSNENIPSTGTNNIIDRARNLNQTIDNP